MAAAPQRGRRMSHTIKNPTRRKVRNRGWEPVRLNWNGYVVHGWIYKRGRELLHIHIIGIGDRKVPLSEETHMVKL